ncbi:MAG: formylglycine-generating enzyme family protein [Magnetococcales bacterium]|nr:formylglycine-generating enzyme family protein [Magnetococcales bacterium]
MMWRLLIGLLCWLGVAIPPRSGEAVEERSFAGIAFMHIPAGCFVMGSPENEPGRDADEGPPHEVCLDGFWLGRHEVTQGEWLRVMGDNPAHFALSEHHPVERVSWEQTREFIRRLDALGEGPFRLPSEAEWEYAARAGTRTPYAFGATLDAATQANFDGHPPMERSGKLRRRNTTPAGSFPANGWGLFDMHGNVSEWVRDWYCEAFYRMLEPRRKNPVCLDDSSGFHVLRGGSWYDDATRLRSADRGWSTPDNRHASIGFRLARPEGP